MKKLDQEKILEAHLKEAGIKITTKAKKIVLEAMKDFHLSTYSSEPVALKIPKYHNAKWLYSRDSGKKLVIERVETAVVDFGGKDEQYEIIYWVPTDGGASGVRESGLTDKRPSKKDMEDYKNNRRYEKSPYKDNDIMYVAAPKFRAEQRVKTDRDGADFIIRGIDVRIENPLHPTLERHRITYWDGTRLQKRRGEKQENISPIDPNNR